jgi:HSP20 family protein
MDTELARFNPFRPPPTKVPWRRLGRYLRQARLRQVLRHDEAVPRIEVEVTESAHHFTIRAALPGTPQDEIVVSLEGNTVYILAGASRASAGRDSGGQLLAERHTVEQWRAITLRHAIERRGARASFDNGVLELVLRKRPPATHVLAVQ